LIGLTQVPTNARPAFSRKPAVQVATAPRIELFRRAVRLVNASNLFPTGPVISQCGSFLGITMVSENPVYAFGNYNAPTGDGIDSGDAFPGLTSTPAALAPVPTSPQDYIGQDPTTCGSNCHVPAAIVADAISFLSGPSVGTTIPAWSGGTGFAGWLDGRSFVTPYQAISFRSARHTVYRFAAISGFTPSWFPGYWGQNGVNQGDQSRYSSGALNNFPRFLEDWGHNGTAPQIATYAGSLIRIYKSVQANGAFKRVSNASVLPTVDYVYRPPSRNWIFDTDFTDPCTLPPGSPFLQLLDFKGFQQSVVQR
jgi:hypothetical protein